MIFTFEKQTKKIIITQFQIIIALQRKQQVSERIYMAKAIRGLIVNSPHKRNYIVTVYSYILKY